MDKEINKHVGKVVNRLRKEQGKFTQENVAQMMGMSRCNVINLEAGRINWSAAQIMAVCRILRCTPNDLFPKVKPVATRGKSKMKTFTITRTTKVYEKII